MLSFTISYEDFKEQISKLSCVTSIKQKKYTIITVNEDYVYFTREGSGKPEVISIKELFDFYCCEQIENINTTTAKLYISGRVQSPAVAILHAVYNNIVNKNNIVANINTTKSNSTFLDEFRSFSKEELAGLGCLSIIVIIFIIFLFSIIFNGCDNNDAYVPEVSEEWKEDAVNNEWNMGLDEEYSNEIMFAYEKKYNRTIQSVLSKYVNCGVVKDQIVLTEEPLRSLIIHCIGEDGLNFMVTCQKSEKGMIKYIDMGVLTYQYDCYKDTPNGDYFAFVLLTDNGKECSFFLEVKINNVMNKFAFMNFN